jgi:hypothetical protein
LLQHLKRSELRAPFAGMDAEQISAIWGGLDNDTRAALAERGPIVREIVVNGVRSKTLVPGIDPSTIRAFHERLIGTAPYESAAEVLHDLNRLSEAVSGTFAAIDGGLGPKPAGTDVVLTTESGPRTLTT